MSEPTTEESGPPVTTETEPRQPAGTADVILIPPLGLEAAAKIAEALEAIKESLAPKVRNALADALQKLAEYLRTPAPAPGTQPPTTPPSTTP
jgi:hypothetical protein